MIEVAESIYFGIWSRHEQFTYELALAGRPVQQGVTCTGSLVSTTPPPVLDNITPPLGGEVRYLDVFVDPSTQQHHIYFF
jgi:hypothetical protein